MYKRRYAIVWRYVAKEFLVSFIVAFLFFFVIFFINQLLLMAEDILSKKAPVGDVVRLVVFSMPAIIAMSFPFGSLVGALMAAGRLSSDNEFMVMRACGISRTVTFVPFLVLGLVFSLVSFSMNDYFLPLGTINYGKLYRKLVTTAPQMALTPHSVKRYGDTTIVTGAVDGSVLYDVLLLDNPPGGASRVISAKRAELAERGGDSGVITLVMDQVFVQESSVSKSRRFEYSSASRMEYNIVLAKFTDFTPGIGPKEMASRDLFKIIQQKESVLADRRKARAQELELKHAELLSAYMLMVSEKAPLNRAMLSLRSNIEAVKAISVEPASDRTLEVYKLEYYKKFSIPAGAFAFVFLAFPLGALSRKSGKAVGFGVGLLVSVAYWALLIGGQYLGLRAQLSPFVAMWAPNILVLLLSVPLFLHRSHS